MVGIDENRQSQPPQFWWGFLPFDRFWERVRLDELIVDSNHFVKVFVGELLHGEIFGNFVKFDYPW